MMTYKQVATIWIKADIPTFDGKYLPIPIRYFIYIILNTNISRLIHLLLYTNGF